MEILFVSTHPSYRYSKLIDRRVKGAELSPSLSCASTTGKLHHQEKPGDFRGGEFRGEAAATCPIEKCESMI
jgi:hypothetical protein